MRVCKLKPVLKAAMPEAVKIDYRVQRAVASSFGDWAVKIIAKRCKVKPPKMYKSATNKSYFNYPNEIYLSKNLYKAEMGRFVATCIHEFAHYLHLGQMSKKSFELLAEKHNREFVKWLVVASRAAFCQRDGERLDPWWLEYRKVAREAAKLGVFVKGKK